MAIRRRKRRGPAADPELQEAAERAEAAVRQLDDAKATRKEQARLREQEQESLVKRLDRLGSENHLASLVLDILQGE